MCPRQNYLDPGDRITDPQEVEGVDAMGRGRQKAKHTKVARELKYFSPETNYSALERELATKSPTQSEEEMWAEYADKYDIDDDEDEN